MSLPQHVARMAAEFRRLHPDASIETDIIHTPKMDGPTQVVIVRCTVACSATSLAGQVGILSSTAFGMAAWPNVDFAEDIAIERALLATGALPEAFWEIPETAPEMPEVRESNQAPPEAKEKAPSAHEKGGAGIPDQINPETDLSVNPSDPQPPMISTAQAHRIVSTLNDADIGSVQLHAYLVYLTGRKVWDDDPFTALMQLTKENGRKVYDWAKDAAQKKGAQA